MEMACRIELFHSRAACWGLTHLLNTVGGVNACTGWCYNYFGDIAVGY